mgnify:CR=1 FL=1
MKKYINNFFDILLGICLITVALVFFDVIDNKYNDYAIYGLVAESVYWIIKYIVSKRK